ncbi:hypothetical protein R3P38DRAFT_1105236 [Favolaschia claudopus]|uniref:Uncharacterized protein n=1 Tax=Favolaschia claudopus TaxID=2862362 RepID=A0AAW0BC17_9AGAR
MWFPQESLKTAVGRSILSGIQYRSASLVPQRLLLLTSASQCSHPSRTMTSTPNLKQQKAHVPDNLPFLLEHYVHPNAWEWFHLRQTSESQHPLHESKVDLPAGWSCDWRNWIWGYELTNLEVDLEEEFGWGIEGRIEPLAYYSTSVNFLFAVYSPRRGRYFYYFHAPGEVMEILRRFRGKFESHDDFLERFGTEWATGQWVELRMRRKRVKNTGHRHHSRRRILLSKGIYGRGMDAHFQCPSWSKYTNLDIRFRSLH